MSDFLTVKEFAVKANVSVQAIYQRLDRDLKPYLKTFKGKKYLSSEGLQFFIKDNSTTIKQELNKDALTEFNESADNSEIELLKDALTAFKEQLKVKDIQISELQAALKAEQEHSAQLTTALSQQQALHAGDIQRQLVEQQQEPKEQASADQTQPEPEQQPEKELAEDPPQQKLSFFQRLFRKRSE